MAKPANPVCERLGITGASSSCGVQADVVPPQFSLACFAYTRVVVDRDIDGDPTFEVSGSQMYHYFPDKNDLLQAVIVYQADSIVSRNRRALSGSHGVEAWRNMVISAARIPSCRWGAAVRHRPGRPRHHSARHARRRTSARPGTREQSPLRNCDRYPPRPCHPDLSPYPAGAQLRARRVAPSTTVTYAPCEIHASTTRDRTDLSFGAGQGCFRDCVKPSEVWLSSGTSRHSRTNSSFRALATSFGSAACATRDGCETHRPCGGREGAARLGNRCLRTAF